MHKRWALAWLLRAALLAFVAIAAGVFFWMVSLGLNVWAALALAVALLFMIHGLPLATEFVTGAIVDRRPLPRLAPMAAIRLWLGETLRSLHAFYVDQPWRSRFAEPACAMDPARPAVLLLHGYMCNRAVWLPWLHTGIAKRWNIATVNLEPPFASIENYLEQIDSAIARLRAASGADRVIVVAHSMGGLAARAYLRAYGDASVTQLITIATPHRGTLFANFGNGANAREMRHNGAYAAGLAAQEKLHATQLRIDCIASQHDNLIVPRGSAMLDGANAHWMQRLGHLQMSAHADVLKLVIQLVDGGTPARGVLNAQ